jgi:hypothetical protein
MATIFGKEERNFFNAFFIPDTSKRRAALDKWIKSTVPVIQAAVTQELEDFVKLITENRWTEEGWKSGEEKLRQIENDYHLLMDIKLRKVSSNEKFRGTLLEPVVRLKIGSNEKTRDTKPNSIMSQTEIDLHGMTVTEAMFHVDDFLKDCYKTHERMVWIIHGKGTGVLREEVRKLLDNHPLVESFSTADKSHGGEGATQVTIKEWDSAK